MPWVAGVDGCRAGWIVVLLEQDQAPDASLLTVQLCASFAEVLALTPVPIVMAIDMPIGLLDAPQSGGRLCDRQARRLLGHRASSVFSPPSRLILDATHYAQVRGHGMSRQAFGILPKIREVDRLMTPTLQQRVYEAHPELAFRWLTGHPMRHNKKTLAGREERLQALVQAPGGLFRDLRPTFARALQTFKRPQAAPDDLLDAYVLAWTARRMVEAHAYRIPVHPEVDVRGLRMEIWY